MKKKFHTAASIVYAAVAFILIIDSPFAINSAKDALTMCLNIIIPSLFPLCVLTSLLTDQLLTNQYRSLNIIRKLCNTNSNSANIFFAGLLGGYPLGARLTANAYRDGTISKKQALQMLAFSSNAGPAFIFGLCTSLFTNHLAALCLWSIHICTAILTARMIPSHGSTPPTAPHKIKSIQETVQSAVKTMGNICGWIILFRIIAAFMDRWLLFMLPPFISSIVQCALELSTGIINLGSIKNELARFIICSGALSFGGICVILQTKSVINDLSIEPYIRGKLIQTPISCILAFLTGGVLLHSNITMLSPLIPPLIIFFAVILQKTMAFFRKIIYNTENKPARSLLCCFAKK